VDQVDEVKLEANTIKACHVRDEDGEIRVIDGREYCWHIPKALRGDIQKGDVLLVMSLGKAAKVVVVDVYREDVEVTGKCYKSVLWRFDRAS
jgi:hypothetical protein